MGELSLIGEWLVTWGDGLHGKSAHAAKPVEDHRRYFPMQFPGSIQQNLIRIGIINDPRISINSLSARWVEEHFWILRKEFWIPEEAVHQNPELIIDIMDGVGKVFLNGIRVGGHSNSHRPASFDLQFALQPGTNEIVILLESGLFKVADLPGGSYSAADESILTKRHQLRQPQYQFGWDWNPRLVFFGIHGDFRIIWGVTPRVDHFSIISNVPENLLEAEVNLHLDWFTPDAETSHVEIVVKIDGEICLEEEKWLPSGRSSTRFSFVVKDPKLWYPRGYGEHPLYLIEFTATQDDVVIDRWIGNIGLRRIEIVQDPHPDEGSFFHLYINNQPVFCKGSNWVPPEMSAYEVSNEKIKKLIELAVEQNFNILRIWGGGVWAGHEMLDLCDQNGIMVWHDLLFACSKYPADNPEFLREVQAEISWGLSEYCSHPSLVVWCGNNELEWGLWSWNYQDFGVTAPDYVLFHHIIPNLINKIDPGRPYWPSSPYTGPDFEPNDPTRGDQHPWQVSLSDRDSPENFWKYRNFVDRFPNEGGVLGLSPAVSLREFLLEDEFEFRSFAWDHHDNNVHFWQERRGVAYLMVEDWFGSSVDKLTVEELVLASGIVQAEGLKEYVRNYRRRWPSSAAAIYWDYVDSWPSVHGWGTLDYYLRKKLSFYSVKRANKPVIVVLSDEFIESEGITSRSIGVYIVNETPESTEFTVHMGQFAPTGEIKESTHKNVIVKGFSSTKIHDIPRDINLVTFAVLLNQEGNLIDWDRILLQKVKDLDLLKPEIKIETLYSGDKRIARYSSETWVWCVVLDKDGEDRLSENAFDLFPGVPYDIDLSDGDEAARVISTGNELLNNIQNH